MKRLLQQQRYIKKVNGRHEQEHSMLTLTE
jgi:hypothetical protein